MRMRRSAWAAAVAMSLAGVALVGWRQWTDWNAFVLPDPVRAGWYVRPEPGVFHTDGGGRPATTIDMLRKVDAVVLARMDSDRTDEALVGARDHKLNLFDFRTGFHFTVIETIKGDLRSGDQITIWRLGQRADREELFLRPNLGETFLCFLSRFPGAGGYEPAFGKYGTYQVTNGLLHQLAPHPTTMTYEGQPVEAFLADLRSLSKSM